MNKEIKVIDNIMINLFNLYTYHMDLSDEVKKLCKETFIETGRELWEECLNEVED